jgi:hypothetical protein
MEAFESARRDRTNTEPEPAEPAAKLSP